MNKKAQISVFIIIGIVIIIALVAYFAVTNKSISPQAAQKMSLQSKSINSFVQSCLTQKSEEAVFILGLQGGQIFFTGPNIDYDDESIAFGSYDGQDILPSVSEEEMQIEYYVKTSLPSCIQNFSEFRTQGLEISDGNISVNVSIAKKTVYVELFYPLEVNNAGVKNHFDKFSSTVNVPLGEIISTARQMIFDLQSDPDWISLTDLTNSNYKIDIIPYNSSVFLYSIVYPQSFGKDYVFFLGVKPKLNQPPDIMAPSRMVFFDGVKQSVTISAYDPEMKNVTFEDDTALFDINSSTGVIDVEPEIPGEYNVTITASDPQGNKAQKRIVVIVVPVSSKPELIVADIIAYKDVLYTGKAYGFDINNNPLVYQADPEWFRINPVTGDISFTPTQVGEFNISVSATNGVGIATQDVVLTVTERTDVNHQPTIQIEDIHAVAGQPFTVVVNASDPDNDPLTFYSDVLPINPATGVLNYMSSQNGTFDVTFAVSDGKSRTEKKVKLIINAS